MSFSQRLRTLLITRLPHRHQLEGSFLHRLFGERLFAPGIWHFDVHKAAAGLGIGACISSTPPFLPHMLLAAVLSFLLRVYLPAALLGCWLVSPLLLPVVAPVEYQVGDWISAKAGRDLAPLEELIHESPEAVTLEKQPGLFKKTLGLMKDYTIGSAVVGPVIGLFVYMVSLFLLSRFEHRLRRWRQGTARFRVEDLEPPDGPGPV